MLSRTHAARPKTCTARTRFAATFQCLLYYFKYNIMAKPVRLRYYKFLRAGKSLRKCYTPGLDTKACTGRKQGFEDFAIVLSVVAASL